MSARNDGGSAFPRELPKAQFSPDECLRIIEQHSGMTLRDYFAAKAMHAEMLTCGVPGQACEEMVGAAFRAGREPEAQIAWNAYRVADAMLAARDAA